MSHPGAHHFALPDIALRPAIITSSTTSEGKFLAANKPRSEKTTKEDFLRLLLDDDAPRERPAKRRKSNETGSLLDLPKLPVKNGGTKRLRIPPTLSGLHQPPPDAGLLPSMSTEKPVYLNTMNQNTSTSSPPGSIRQHAEQATERSQPTLDSILDTPNESSQAKSISKLTTKPKRKHNKWTQQESDDLLRGVAKFGIGNWTKILNCADYEFNEKRTALDLKDRFRLVCPEMYSKGQIKAKEARKVVSNRAVNIATPAEEDFGLAKPSAAISSAQLEILGIHQPFEKSRRRQRTEWSDAEDTALLQGFKKYGKAWIKIRNSYQVLSGRTSTDLRDRLRTKHPAEYAELGLKPHINMAGDKVGSDKIAVVKAAGTKEDKPNHEASNTAKRSAQSQLTETRQPPTVQSKKQAPPTSILHVDDVFWGAPFEPDVNDSEPITLDRGILDWAYDFQRPSIDPLATLNLPLPTATNPPANSSVNPGAAAAVNSAGASSSSYALPSLAAITALNDVDALAEPLELPSLLTALGNLEHDGKTSTHFMSMDELLS